jgi:ATP-dependent DNA helicase RecQ
MPRSIESWYQEIGRAGRDSLPSDCVVLWSWADVIGYDSFLSDITDPDLRRETRRKTVELFELLSRGTCRHQALVGYFDEQIEPCEGSCDVCRGAGIESLVAHTPPRRGKRRSGDQAGALVERTIEPLDSGELPIPDLEDVHIPGPTPSRRGARLAGRAGLAPAETARFERLRALRKRLADSEGVPAYIVFGDAVLVEMARELPRTRRAMLGITGVGRVKLERYGDAFLELLREG